MELSPEAKVHITDKCQECKGTGVVSNPIWEQFNTGVKAGTASIEKMEEWFRERGEARQQTHTGTTYWALPPEELTCGECEGAKFITRLVPMAEFAKFLASYLEKK